MIDLSIIIVSWNVREHLERCLASIERAKGEVSLEVFVVDNASTDGTQEWLANQESRITNHGLYSLFFIRNSQNKGFAAANNQAMARTTGQYVLLLNPDTEFPSLTPPNLPLYTGRRGGVTSRNALEAMIDFMRAHPRCGILGPKLLNADGTLQPSVRRLPSAWSTIVRSLDLPARRYMAMDFDYAQAQKAEQVMGACFLIRRACMSAVGLLDEHFFIWFEEVDYCKRAAEAWWEVWYTPTAEVMHHGGQSFAQLETTKKQWMFSKSLCYYFQKHGQWGAFAVTAATLPFRLLFTLFQ